MLFFLLSIQFLCKEQKTHRTLILFDINLVYLCGIFAFDQHFHSHKLYTDNFKDENFHIQPFNLALGCLGVFGATKTHTHTHNTQTENLHYEMDERVRLMHYVCYAKASFSQFCC